MTVTPPLSPRNDVDTLTFLLATPSNFWTTLHDRHMRSRLKTLIGDLFFVTIKDFQIRKRFRSRRKACSTPPSFNTALRVAADSLFRL